MTPHWRGSLFHVIIMRVALKFHSPISPDPLSARSLRSLGFPKSPPYKKILDPPMHSSICLSHALSRNQCIWGYGCYRTPTENPIFWKSNTRTPWSAWPQMAAHMYAGVDDVAQDLILTTFDRDRGLKPAENGIIFGSIR